MANLTTMTKYECINIPDSFYDNTDDDIFKYVIVKKCEDDIKKYMSKRFTKDELKFICVQNNIKGFKKLKKKELIEFTFENIFNDLRKFGIEKKKYKQENTEYHFEIIFRNTLSIVNIYM